jgi:Tol biopolymer transport system component
MELKPGEKLGRYQLLSPIGEGGMGEVWKARDTQLDRDVALKVSKSEFTARFDREARAIAAFNHPNICTLHDVGPNYLVMELIDGVPLKGPLPVEKAVAYAALILDALDAAHHKGFTHRDLKPANILVTKQGIKLLDFGLAKQQSTGLGSDDTTSAGITAKGQITGTLQYMSPEQLQGQEADARSDIFAFGCVLYEMLSGKKAFSGSTGASVIAAILEREPEPLQTTPPLDRVIRTCLAKDPDERFQAARDLKRDLLWAIETSVVVGPAANSRGKQTVPIIVALAIAAVAAWAWWRKPAPEASAPLRYSLDAPPGATFQAPFFGSAISPDGRLLAFSALKKGAAAPTMWLRRMDSLDARELSGTDNANGFFWSPDSRSVGFIAEDKLKHIDAASGAVQTICDAPAFEGGSWNSEGVILFSSARGGLRRVPAAGGTPVPVTTLRGREGDHRYPWFLPDSRSFLYTATGGADPATGQRYTAGVFLASLDKPDQTVRLLDSDSKAVYAPPRNGLPGYLLWLRDQSLMAQRLDAKSRRLEGDAVPVATSIATPFSSSGRRAAYWISDQGVLVYRTVGRQEYLLAWKSRDGKQEDIASTGAEATRSGDPAISPDGRRIALEREIAGNFDVWVYELSRGVMTRLTFDPGFDWFPVWSPDGRQVAYSGQHGIYLKDASGGGQAQLLAGSKVPIHPSSWSRDGRYLLYVDGRNIWALPLTGKQEDRKPFVWLKTPFLASHPQFSPDGKWVAYVSNESGRDEVYLQAFAADGGKWQVSDNGGREPRWRGDGKEVFFVAGSNGNEVLRGAGIRAAKNGIEIDPARDLFKIVVVAGPDYEYDVSPDGQRFLTLQPFSASFIDGVPLTVVSDWQAGLRK